MQWYFEQHEYQYDPNAHTGTDTDTYSCAGTNSISLPIHTPGPDYMDAR
jgi:hypothetical protein